MTDRLSSGQHVREGEEEKGRGTGRGDGGGEWPLDKLMLTGKSRVDHSLRYSLTLIIIITQLYI